MALSSIPAMCAGSEIVPSLASITRESVTFGSKLPRAIVSARRSRPSRSCVHGRLADLQIGRPEPIEKSVPTPTKAEKKRGIDARDDARVGHRAAARADVERQNDHLETVPRAIWRKLVPYE